MLPYATISAKMGIMELLLYVGNHVMLAFLILVSTVLNLRLMAEVLDMLLGKKSSVYKKTHKDVKKMVSFGILNAKKDIMHLDVASVLQTVLMV
jgi:hypothetical protein